MKKLYTGLNYRANSIFRSRETFRTGNAPGTLGRKNYTWAASLMIFAMFFASSNFFAQTNIANYTLSKSTGAVYTPITGGTVFITGAYDSEVSTAITMGGTFPYGGANLTTCFISANGAITFGASSSSTTILSTLGTTTGAIAAFAQDGASSTATGAAPEIRYQDLGTEFVVQYTDHANYFNRTTDRLNFQIRLTYATGAINIVYGPCTNPGVSTSGQSVQVGIRGNSTTYATNVNNLSALNVPAATTCDWFDAVTGYANSSTLLFSGTTNANVKIPAGLTYTWTPGTQLPVRTFAATTGITTASATLSWTAPTGATGYNVQYRIPGTCAWTNWSGNPVATNSVTLTGLTQNTSYQVRVQALNGTAQSIYSHIPNTAGTGDGYSATGTFTTQANCPSVVTALTSSALTTNAATIGWTAPATPPANGYEYYYSTSSTAPTVTTTPSGSTGAGLVTANLTGLSSGTTYYYWVRTNCNGTDKGNWVGSSNFTTVCVPAAVPYTQNFDTTATGSSTNTNAPNCWAYLETASSAGYGYVTTGTAVSTPNNFYMYNSTDITGNNMLVSPETVNLTDGTKRVKFSAKASTAGYTVIVGLLTNPADPTTFTAIGSPISLTTTHTIYTVNIPAGSGSWLAFKHGLGGTNRSIYLDDIIVENIPSCVEPTSLNTASSTSTSATFSWTAPLVAPANGYQIYYSTSNTAPTGTTVLDASNSVSSATTSATISGLTPNTAYYVWVRSNCSTTDQSVWSIGISVVTLCNASSVPYSENFDTTPVGSSTNNNAPTCWRYLEPAGWPGYGYVSTNNSSTPNGYYIYSTDITGGGMLVSPPTTNLMSGTNRVRFMANAGGANYNIQVGTLSNPNDAASFTAIGAPIPITTTFTQYTVNIPTGTNQYLAFRHPGQTVAGTSVRVDDIFVEALPTCNVPTAVNVTSVTLNSVSLSWTAPSVAPANGYQVYYSTSNTAPTGATVLDASNSVSSATTSATISGLTAGTSYYVWVRSSCNTTEQSLWVGPTSVYTGYCVPSAATYYIDVLTSTGASTNISYTGTATTPGGYRDLTATDKIANYVGSVTPINISGDGSFSTYGFAVWVDWNSNLQFETTERMFVTSAYANSASGSITVPTGTALGNYRARVQMNYNDTAPSNPCITSISGEHIDFTFEVTTPPACLAPTGLAVSPLTATSATLTWTAPTPAPANGYEYSYSTTNTTPTTGTATTNTSEVLSPLTPATTYYYWVRSMCASSQSSWVSGTFTTPSLPPANDECATAIALTPGATFVQNAVTGTTVASSNSTALTAGCLFTPANVAGNVWYTVQVPASGSITIETGSVTGSPLTDTVLTVYDACGSTTSIACDDDGSTGAFSVVTLTGQTPGATLYISVFRYSTGTDGQFQVSAYDGSLGASEATINENSVKIYPNPFQDVLNITDVKDVTSVIITDISGRTVKTIAKPTAQLQLGGLTAGMYLVTLKYKDGSVKTMKAIKK